MWSTISTVLITLAVLPATLDDLLPILASLGHTLGSLVLFVLRNLQVDFLQSVVDRRTGNQVVLLGEVDPRETVKTSFWTPAFFQSWSVWMGVVLLDHCQEDQNNFCPLLYLAGVFYTGLELSLA